MKKINVIKISVSIAVFLLLTTSFIPGITSKKIKNNEVIIDDYEPLVDIDFIQNVTENLSYMIFTEYNESSGEIAKGRAFGTKGEIAAGNYLEKTMRDMGVWAWKEKLEKRYKLDYLTSKVDVLEYDVQISNITKSYNVTCNPMVIGVTPSTIGKLSKMDLNFSFSNIAILNKHPDSENDDKKYFYLKRTPAENFTYNGISYYKIIKKLFDVFIPDLSDRNNHPNMIGELIYRPNPYKNKDVYDQVGSKTINKPRFFINETIGELLNDSLNDDKIDNYTISFNLTQVLNTSLESYNIIGMINGSNPFKTVLIGGLYDSWWCQGTGDAAIGMAIVLGIAKYFKDNNIKPKYNLKFVCFSGEEHGCKGAIYYTIKHKFENIDYYIDLNQVGFRQENPGCRMEICSNSRFLIQRIWNVIEESNYLDYAVNVSKIVPVVSRIGHLSNDMIFAIKRPFFIPFYGVKTLCFLKNGQWLYHHRDSKDHMDGDTMKYFDRDETAATGDMVLNVTRLLVDNSYC